MKIAIIGTKGIPANYGGFETFAYHLAKNLSVNHDITVVNEKGNLATEFDFPVHVLYSDYEKSIHPLKFYRQSLKITGNTNDIVLVCGVGGSLFYPLKKGAGKIVTNVDGLEHKRRKYTFMQRAFVFILQIVSTFLSDHLIADSDAVKDYWFKRFHVRKQKMTSVAYGAEVPVNFNDSVLEQFDLKSREYYLVVGRLVPENNLKMILEAFTNYKGKKKLVVVGNVKDNPFAKSISENANENVIFTDGIYEKDKLDSLRKHCYAYIHGHSVGGTNPALLEAMVAKCACICHDNEFNREVTQGNQMYFRSVSDLTDLLNGMDSNTESVFRYSQLAFRRVMENYSWENISRKYEEVFESLLRSEKR